MNHSNALLGLLELAVPFYGLRLSRRFGTRQIGWALATAFAVLALMRLMGVELGGLRPDWALTWTLICALVPVLLLIGMAHLEAVYTERHRAERAARLARSAEAAAEQAFPAPIATEVMAQVAAAAAQHFNRHLAVIDVYSRLLMQKPFDARTAEHHRRIAEEAARAAALSQRLLSTGRTNPMRPELIDMSRFVQYHLKQLQQALGQEVLLEQKSLTTLPLVQADPGHLRFMLEQLVRNSVEASSPQGVVTIKAHPLYVDAAHARRQGDARRGRYVRLSVVDAGAGMSPEVQEHLFEPFCTTKDRSRHAGLGLASVHGLVKEHRGWMEVQSEPGRGTTVHVYLPVAG